MSAFVAGQIVIADWRDALPKEANRLRPAVVVEASDLFAPDYPNLILVPITRDVNYAIPDLSLTLEPTAENGCTTRCYVLAAHVTATSKQRIQPTSSCISAAELAQVRRMIAVALGICPA